MPLTQHDRHNMSQLALAFRANNASLICARRDSTDLPIIAILGKSPEGNDVYWPFAILLSPHTRALIASAEWPPLAAPIDLSTN